MAKVILEDVVLDVDSNDISSYVKSCSLDYGAEIHDVTAMGDGGKDKITGFTDWKIEAEVYTDATLSGILFPLVGAAAVACKVRETSGALGAGNPEYQGDGLVASFPPISGSVGQPHVVTLTIEGTKTLTRATS